MKKAKKFFMVLGLFAIFFGIIGVSSCDSLEVGATWENDNLLYYDFDAEAGTYSVVSVYDKTATKIVIPSIFHDKPVTEIGEEAFSLCENLRSVEIGDEVITIEAKAFRWCSSLTDVKFG